MIRISFLCLLFSSLFSSFCKAQDYTELNPDKNSAFYTMALREHPNSPDLYLKRGYAWFLNDSVHLALNDLDSSILLWPGDTARSLRAFIHSNSFGDEAHYKLAIMDYTELIKKHPVEIELYHKRAHCYSMYDDYANAINDLHYCAKLYPYDYDIYDELFGNYESWEQPEKGKLEYLKGARAFGHLADSLKNNAAAFYCEGKLIGSAYRFTKEEYKMKEAIPYLEKALKLDSFNYRYHFELGFTYGRIKKPLIARKYFQRAIDLSPRAELCYLYLAGTYEDVGDTIGAIDICTKGIKINPDSWQIYQARGGIYLRMKQYAKSEADYKMRDKLSGN